MQAGDAMATPDSIHLDLDGAWPAEILGCDAHVDCRAWGPELRYSATRKGMTDFEAVLAMHPARFALFGWGDFHHLTALRLRQIDEPFVLITFDTHPDWDIRPPRWCCGT